MRLLKMLMVIVACAIAGPAVAGPFEDFNRYRQLAEQGDADAQNSLGTLYSIGLGAPHDSAAALAWYRKAADRGHALAQYNLGTMYAYGNGVPQDHSQAAAWYRKAADQGDIYGQESLGNMYARGQGVPQDYVLAHMWLNLAAARAASIDDFLFKRASNARDSVARKMAPGQLAEAQKLARDWKPKR